MSDEREVKVEIGKTFTLPSGVVVRQIVRSDELSDMLRAVLQMQEGLTALASDIRQAMLAVQIEGKGKQ